MLARIMKSFGSTIPLNVRATTATAIKMKTILLALDSMFIQLFYYEIHTLIFEK